MATKNKKHKRRGGPGLFEQAQRSLARGDFKQALKDARVCYRQEPSEAHHRFLERASLARAQELHRFGMRDECRAVLQSLLDLGVTDPSIEQELAPMLLAAGLFDRSGAGRKVAAPEADPVLLAAAADHAVIRPEEAPASLAGIREGAASVRAALQALEGGDEAGAWAAVKDVARGSPFADWRYFVRGLIAYYRRDLADMGANWDRLDPNRFAARIAAPLKALADPGAASRNDPHIRRGLARIAEAVLGGPVLSHLYELRTHLAADRWKHLLERFRKAQPALRQFDPELPPRIVQILFDLILHKGLKSRLAELTSIVDPPPLDPHWNRAWAMFWDYSQTRDSHKSLECWQKYLEDLAGLECLSPEERTLAQAMVWEILGNRFVAESQAALGAFRRYSQTTEQLEARAAECFGKCLQLAPNLLSAYQALADAQIGWGKPDEAAETYRRLLEQFPENLDALLFLARHHLRDDEPLKAREYASRAQRLKPANRAIVTLLWAAHVGSARYCALAGEWEKGRAEFAAAEKLLPGERNAYHLLACKAIFELKARNFQLGEELAEQAKVEAGEPAPALLALAVEAIRYDLSATARKGFERQWKSALKKKCSGQTAGLMCQYMSGHLMTSVPYPGWRGHATRVVAYVRRCSRVKWESAELRDVCTFLEVLSHRREFASDTRLLEDLVRKGRRTLPNDPVFYVLAGELELAKGPFQADRRFAHRSFQQAVELGKGTDDPRAAEAVSVAKRRLTFLEEVGLAPLHSPYDYDDEDEDQDDYFDEDEDDEDDERAEYHDRYTFGSDHGGSCEEDEWGDFDDEALPSLAALLGLEGELPPGFPQGELMRMFANMCANVGIDPKEVLNQAAAQGAIGRRPPGSKSRCKGRRKKS